MARTFALIAPFWRVLLVVSCSSETVPNAPKWKETHENMSLGSNGVDREHSLQKILERHCVINFCINCTSLALLHQVSCSSETVQKAPEQKETHQNMSLGSNSVDRERSLQTILTRQRGLNFCINCTSLALLHQFSCSSETVQNTPEWKEMHQNMSLGSNSVDWEFSLPKILTRHRGLNFCINCTSLALFAASLVQ